MQDTAQTGGLEQGQEGGGLAPDSVACCALNPARASWGARGEQRHEESTAQHRPVAPSITSLIIPSDRACRSSVVK